MLCVTVGVTGVQRQWADEQIAKDTVSLFDNPKDLAAQTLLIYSFGLLNKFIFCFFKGFDLNDTI